jgi:hypothetical protein
MSIVSGWLVKVVIALAVLAIVGYDGIAITIAHVSGKTDAGNAAYAAAQSWQSTKSVDQVLVAAQTAIPAGDVLVGCQATTDEATTWTCTVRRTADTVLLSHLSFLKSDLVATETGNGSYAP